MRIPLPPVSTAAVNILSVMGRNVISSAFYADPVERHLLRGGVHYLTLSSLVEPIKWRFSGLCYFHQASSNCIVFVANGV